MTAKRPTLSLKPAAPKQPAAPRVRASYEVKPVPEGGKTELSRAETDWGRSSS